MLILHKLNIILAEETAGTPGFQTEEAKTFVSSYLTPIISTATWAIPSVTVLAIIIAVIKHNLSDEDERENKPIRKKVLSILIAGVIGTAAATIVRIAGIA